MFVSSKLPSLGPQSVSVGVADWPGLGVPLDTEGRSRVTKGRIILPLLRFMHTKQVKSGHGSPKTGLGIPGTGGDWTHSQCL